ncbi:MAG: 4-aminobutyrate--2-oxoglutarate transaminase [Bifidobacteriaceae bacterium]|jgi:4-aminobutyrate aminotransferase/(S)-3-amino-2-methylpropionate transaminase|nr:4-aminobutyrate--2-oxoglutarate transaminase [Bifidobacteriaceae bacterium]
MLTEGVAMPLSPAVGVNPPALPQVRKLVTEIPGPRSKALAARLRQAVPRALHSPTLPVFAAQAGGGVLVDVDGNSLIDLGSGIAVTTVGAANPEVVAAVRQQVAQFTHTCFMVSPYESYVALAERLAARYPGLPADAVRAAFFNSGAEAVENAVKIARAATGREAVVVFDHAFHGRTSLTMAMTAKAKPYKAGFAPFAPEVYRVSGSYPYRDGRTGPQAALSAISQIETQIGAAQVAAVVFEPIQGEGGFIVPAPGFIEAIAQWCQTHGVVFVADEIQSGIARTGDFFAIEDSGATPDLITVAKGIAGGMPLSGVVGKAEVMDAAGPGGIGGTYGGNPAATAAALAVLDVIERDGLAERARQIGAVLRDGLAAIQQDDPRIGEIRGRGAMMALELVDPANKAPAAALAKAVAAHCIGAGVITLTCGTYGNVIRFLPPLTISDDLLRDALGVLRRALSAI